MKMDFRALPAGHAWNTRLPNARGPLKSRLKYLREPAPLISPAEHASFSVMRSV